MGLSSDDKLEIQELLARRCHAFDFDDLEGMLDSFTDDGQITFAEGASLDLDSGSRPLTPVLGKEAIREHVLEQRPHLQGTRHWLGNVVIDDDAEDGTATAKCFWNLVDPKNDGRTVVSGRYFNTVAKGDGVWRIRVMEVQFD